jgi:hypothetical protein
MEKWELAVRERISDITLWAFPGNFLDALSISYALNFDNIVLLQEANLHVRGCSRAVVLSGSECQSTNDKYGWENWGL